MIAIIFFSGHYPLRQPVLLERQRAGGKGHKGAGRVDTLVRLSCIVSWVEAGLMRAFTLMLLPESDVLAKTVSN